MTLLKLNFSIPYILCKDFFRFPPPPPSLWFPVYLSCHTLCYLDELSDFIFYLLKLLTFSLRLSPLFFSLTLEGVCLLVQIKPPTTVLHLIEWFLNRLVVIFLNFWTTQFAFLSPPPSFVSFDGLYHFQVIFFLEVNVIKIKRGSIYKFCHTFLFTVACASPLVLVKVWIACLVCSSVPQFITTLLTPSYGFIETQLISCASCGFGSVL